MAASGFNMEYVLSATIKRQPINKRYITPYLFIIAERNLAWNILPLGSGGREHAFAQKLSESALLKHLYIIPAMQELCVGNKHFG